MRKRVFDIIEVAQKGDTLSNVYDMVMMVVIIASIVPLAFKAQPEIFQVIDRIAVCIFIVDYLLRLLTADLKYPQYQSYAFLIYPFTPLAIIDLLSILPSVSILNSGFRLFRLFRLVRTFRVFRAFKMIRYSKNMQIILNVFKRQRRALLCVGSLAVAYILISALVIFNVEPDSFRYVLFRDLLGHRLTHNRWIWRYLSDHHSRAHCDHDFRPIRSRDCCFTGRYNYRWLYKRNFQSFR